MSSWLRTCLACGLIAWGCGGKSPQPPVETPGSSVAIQPISFDGLSPICRGVMACCQELAAERPSPAQGMRCPELADAIRAATMQLDEAKVTAVCRTLKSVLARKVERIPQSCQPVATTGGKPKAKTFTPRVPKPKKPRALQGRPTADASALPEPSDAAVETAVDVSDSPRPDGRSPDAGPRPAPADIRPPRPPQSNGATTRDASEPSPASPDTTGAPLPRSE